MIDEVEPVEDRYDRPYSIDPRVLCGDLSQDEAYRAQDEGINNGVLDCSFLAVLKREVEVL